jgi:hypothetical protein
MPGNLVATEADGSNAGSILPMRDDMVADKLFSALNPVVAKFSDGTPIFPKFPTGTVGIGMKALNTEKQIDYFLPCDPRLISVNAAGDPDYSSMVADLTPNNEIDPDRIARLHSFWWVIKKPTGGYPFPDRNFLAWNIGQSGRDPVLGGWVIDSTVEGGDGRVLGNVSNNLSGFLSVGEQGDIHQLGTDKDGHGINSAHIDTDAYFRMDLGRDAPLFFTADDYKEPDVHGGFLTPVHLRFDPKASHPFILGARRGMWKWEAETNFYVVRPKYQTEIGGGGEGGGGGSTQPKSAPDGGGVNIFVNPRSTVKPQPAPESGLPGTTPHPIVDNPTGVNINPPIERSPLENIENQLDDAHRRRVRQDQIKHGTWLGWKGPQTKTDSGGTGIVGKALPGETRFVIERGSTSVINPPSNYDPLDPIIQQLEDKWRALQIREGKAAWDNFDVNLLKPQTIIPEPTVGGIPPVGKMGSGEAPGDMLSCLMDFVLSNLKFRAMDVTPGALDLGKVSGDGLTGAGSSQFKDAVDKINKNNPVVGGSSTFGQQGGQTGTTGKFATPVNTGGALEPWAYTDRPGEGRTSNRYMGGTARGGIIYTPPEVDLMDADIDFLPSDSAVSEFYVMTAPGAYWGAGSVRTSTARPKLGYRWGIDLSNNLLFERTDTWGVTYKVARMSATGLLQFILGDSTSWGNVEGQIDSSLTTVSTAGTGGEEILLSVTVPAYTLNAAKKGVRIKAWGKTAANANAKTLKLYWGHPGSGGASIITNDITVSPNNLNWTIDAEVFCTGASAQKYLSEAILGAVDQTVGVGTAALTDTSDILVVVVGQAAANDIAAHGLLVEAIT